LYRVVRNKAIDKVRRKARHPQVRFETALQRKQEPEDLSGGPVTLLSGFDDVAMMRSILEELRRREPKTNYRLVELLWLEERPGAEVAEILRLTLNKVKCRKNRLLKKLRILINEHNRKLLAPKE
jgi:DNA-directed RNA polymerase specialized sigma24 family protein